MRIFYKERYNNIRKVTLLEFIKFSYAHKTKFIDKDFVGWRYIYEAQNASDYIYNKLNSGKACLIARYGTTELSIVKYFLQHKETNNCAFPERLKTNISTLSGFFPTSDNLLARFACEFLKIISNIDILGVRKKNSESAFFTIEDFFIQHYSKNSILIDIRQISPFFIEKPWIRILSDKKILVIHPFADTIESQYYKRELIFNNADVYLPKFHLITLKAVQSLADSKYDLHYATWFDALEDMCNQIDRTNFDVALIGAGAYGIFLGNYVKSIGKQAIHVGGALQLFFGIKGKRWDNIDITSALYNDHWVYPAEHEKPKGLIKVEQGCYW
jgi:hypothetical protein